MKMQDFSARLLDLIQEALDADLSSDRVCSELELQVYRLNEGDFN